MPPAGRPARPGALAGAAAPMTRRGTAREVLVLPVHPGLGPDDIDRIVSRVRGIPRG